MWLLGCCWVVPSVTEVLDVGPHTQISKANNTLQVRSSSPSDGLFWHKKLQIVDDLQRVHVTAALLACALVKHVPAQTWWVTDTEPRRCHASVCVEGEDATLKSTFCSHDLSLLLTVWRLNTKIKSKSMSVWVECRDWSDSSGMIDALCLWLVV